MNDSSHTLFAANNQSFILLVQIINYLMSIQFIRRSCIA
ncbi:hypothetical protein UYSO10_4011 [Kosakonia radicincitans]|nr:hypothetical protein UYSO10_4011 [Kosakonia radicincitans]